MAASSSKNSSKKPSPSRHDEDIIPSFEELGLSFGSFTPQEIRNIMSSSSSSENKQEEKRELSSYRRVRNEFVRMAKTEKGSLELLKRIEYEDPMQWQEILDEVLECIFEVMTDEYGHHLFLKLLECCNLPQFQTIILTLQSNEDLLINASLLKHGSIAVQGFIKKLKPTGLAHYITSLLSKRFVELMTSEQGRHVVVQCLYTFGTKENEVLFSCAIRHFKELATTEYGCDSLNDCLHCIRGVQRMQLLQNIADESNFLVNDPWGTIVLETVLILNNKEAIQKICDCLKMEYIKLARRKDGSRVVQKCIRASEYGMKSVVESLLGSGDALLQLANHKFGNYVIQAALLTARTFDIKLYESLVAVLEPHNLALSSTKNGRKINILIKKLESSKITQKIHF